MTSIPHYIQALEAYIERSGARLVASAVTRVRSRAGFTVDLITLRADLSPRAGTADAGP